MMNPEDPDAGWTAGAGHLRVSDADRERMVDLLKTAFVRGQLSLGELAHRAGQALEARTSAQLAAVAADILARPAAAGPQREPAHVPARARPVSRKAIAWAVSLIIVLPALSAAFVATYYGGFIIVFILAFFAAGWLDSYDSARIRRHRAH